MVAPRAPTTLLTMISELSCPRSAESSLLLCIADENCHGILDLKRCIRSVVPFFVHSSLVSTTARKARLQSQLFSCSRVNLVREAAIQSSSVAGTHCKPRDKDSGSRKLPSGRDVAKGVEAAVWQRCSVPIGPRVQSRFP